MWDRVTAQPHRSCACFLPDCCRAVAVDLQVQSQPLSSSPSKAAVAATSPAAYPQGLLAWMLCWEVQALHAAQSQSSVGASPAAARACFACLHMLPATVSSACTDAQHQHPAG